MTRVNPLQKTVIASVALAALLIPSAASFASDSPKPSTSAPTSTLAGGVPAPKSTFTPAQIQALQATVDTAKATYVADANALKQAQAALSTLQQKYKADLKAAQDKALADAKAARQASKPTQSPAIVQAQAAVTASYLLLNTDRNAVSIAEKASKASPTDATLLSTLAAARTKATADLNAYNAAVLAYKLLVKSAEPTPVASVPSTPPATPAPQVVDPKLKAAQDLVTSTYLAFNDARNAVSVAEKASKASPTDATLLATLTAARTKATAANNAFLSAQQAYKILTLATPRQEPSEKPTPSVTPAKPNTANSSDQDNHAILEAATKAFIALHPDYTTDVNAVTAAVQALQSAGKALSDAQVALRAATNPGLGDHGFPRPLPPVPAASPSTSPRA